MIEVVKQLDSDGFYQDDAVLNLSKLRCGMVTKAKFISKSKRLIMEENEKISALWHTFNCIICGREITYFAVNKVNKRCPCIKCLLKELGKDNTE